MIKTSNLEPVTDTSSFSTWRRTSSFSFFTAIEISCCCAHQPTWGEIRKKKISEIICAVQSSASMIRFAI